MILYAIIMFSVAILFGIVAVMIYRGRIDLIHDYHRKNVTDEKGYGKAFGKAFGIIPVAMTGSGVLALVWDKSVTAVIVLMLGLIAGICEIVSVQKKYNGGMF